jgi:hypothetical protein
MRIDRGRIANMLAATRRIQSFMDSRRALEGPDRTFHPRQSPAALVLALVMVAGAVAFGIFGRSIAGRLSMGGGTPLADFVSLVGDMRGSAILACLQKQEEPALHLEEARGIVQRTLRRGAQIPDPGPDGFELRQVVDIPMAQAQVGAIACATYQGTGASEGRWIHLFMARDDGQYLSFDSLGRPRPLAPGIPIEGELPGRSPSDPAVVIVWSDGPVLHAACFEDEADAERFRDAMGVP